MHATPNPLPLSTQGDVGQPGPSGPAGNQGAQRPVGAPGKTGVPGIPGVAVSSFASTSTCILRGTVIGVKGRVCGI